MGYQSNYELNTCPHTDGDQPVKRAIIEQAGFDPFDDCCKWYDHVQHMREVSRKFPTTILTLYRRGEDGREWVLHFFDGVAEEHERPEWDRPPPSRKLLERLTDACALADRLAQSVWQRLKDGGWVDQVDLGGDAIEETLLDMQRKGYVVQARSKGKSHAWSLTPAGLAVVNGSQP